MSSFPELERTLPSLEVQREMALDQIRSFQSMNMDYRQLATLIHQHPSSGRITTLREICSGVKDSSEPIIEAGFFRDVDPSLVSNSVNALIDEILQNRELDSALGGNSYDSDEFSGEFRQTLIERVLANDQELDDEDSSTPLFVTNPLEELPTKSLVSFIGAIHEGSIRDILESLEESESVEAGLEKEYIKKERIRTVVIGFVAFAGALGGSLIAGKINKQK